MSKAPQIDPKAEVRDPITLFVAHHLGGGIRDFVLGGVVMTIIGFGGGVLEWRRYSGLRVHESEFLSLMGLAAISWLLVRAARWALASRIQADTNNP